MSQSPLDPTSFSLDCYQARREEISLHMSHFFLGYLKEIHRHFEGDLALVIVLAEIAHHSSSEHFQRPTGASGLDAQVDLSRLPSCSAYSLAAATHLPRETVRRKIGRLIELGWVEKVGRAEVRITSKVGEHFLPDFNVWLLDQLLQTADRIRGVMAPEPSFFQAP